MKTLVVEDVSVAGVDVAIIIGYMLSIVAIGLFLSRRASKDLDSYFLGGRQMPWWLLGLSGTACYFDVAGVMWTIAAFYAMGQQFFWPQFMWGYVAMLGCFAAFMGKWLRRSRVLTGAEWMVARFGDRADGRFARSAYAVMAVTISVAFVGFAEFGCAAFLETFVAPPESLPEGIWRDNWGHVLAVGLMALTSIYTISAGLIGVGLTGFIQFVIVLIGSSVLIGKAIAVSSPTAIQGMVGEHWLEFTPPVEWPQLADWPSTAGWVAFLPLTLTWLAKGMALGAGGPQQLYDLQRFLAAKSPREASLAGMIWGVGLVPMFMVSAAVGVIGLVTWGPDIENPDQLYPLVIGTMLPVGLKGLVLAGLLSAFMSTFSATVNAGASYLTFDLYGKFLQPNATTGHLVKASRVCSLLIVVGGVAIGVTSSDINTIFEWIMMVLGAGVLMPNVLRWFWWRFNGAGFAFGTLCGVAAAIVAVSAFPDAAGYVTFPILLAISTVTSVAATLVTQPTDMPTLVEFYRRVRPAGWWRPVHRELLSQTGFVEPSGFGWDALSAVITAVGLQALFLMSTYAVTHQWQSFRTACVVLAASSVLLYFTWYRRLPARDEPDE